MPLMYGTTSGVKNVHGGMLLIDGRLKLFRVVLCFLIVLEKLDFGLFVGNVAK